MTPVPRVIVRKSDWKPMSPGPGWSSRTRSLPFGLHVLEVAAAAAPLPLARGFLAEP